MEFFISLKKIPTTTHQQKKVHVVKGKPIFYEPQNLKEARDLFMRELSKHKPDKPFDGGVRLITKWCFVSSTQKGVYKTTRPDTDNLVKLLKDCMGDLNFFHDDAQVASEVTEKFWNDICGIYVKLEDLEGE